MPDDTEVAAAADAPAPVDTPVDTPAPVEEPPQGRTNMPGMVEIPTPEPEPEPAPPPATAPLAHYMLLLEAGHTVTRVAWMNSARRVSVGRRGTGCVFQVSIPWGCDFGTVAALVPSAEDLAADDWYIV